MSKNVTKQRKCEKPSEIRTRDSTRVIRVQMGMGSIKETPKA
jgi:hypothetical protein